MTVLPPSNDSSPANVARQSRRRWRLSLAAATVIASVIAAVATFVVNRPRQSEVRQDIDRLERLMTEQKSAIEKLEVVTARNSSDVEAIRKSIDSRNGLTSTSAPTLQHDTASPGVTTSVINATTSSPTKEQDRYSFTLQGCSKSGGSVTCRFSVTNKDDQERRLELWPRGTNPSRAFVNGGGEYIAERTSVGAGPNARQDISLPPGITVPAQVYFTELPEAAREFTVLQVRFWSSTNSDNILQWRAVPLAP